MSFRYYRQLDSMDCGPTCLKMVAKYYGRFYSNENLKRLAGFNREGVSLLGISEAAENIGMRSTAATLSVEQIRSATLPAILYWKNEHFVVLHKVKGRNFFIADPARGPVKISEKQFCENWYINSNHSGIALLLEPSIDFHTAGSEDVEKKVSLSKFLSLGFAHRNLFTQLGLGLLIGSVLQLIIPFLTQAIVDIGINTQNLNFIYIVLLAQFMLLIGKVSVDFIRSWILLHISTRLNTTILADFLAQLMQLPISFFESKVTGDIIQRMSDQKRIESFLTQHSFNIIFSFFNLLVFSVVLVFYNINVFIVFIVGPVCYSLWIMVFLKYRRRLDYKLFDVSSANQTTIIQLILGMQEIKLNGCEREKRWEWERIQARLFKFNIKTLALEQYQQAGTFLINEGKNILITFLVAVAVIQGQITLGGMMAILYILGQLNSPVEQLLGFITAYQDAQLSMERLNEIYEIEKEDSGRQFSEEVNIGKSISFDNVSFKYPGSDNGYALKNITFRIPQGKTTAIVGMSGSGKTTLIKLLLGFHAPNSGDIKCDSTSLSTIKPSIWRKYCGVVMQDGFIFSDTIAKNIAVHGHINQHLLESAIDIANLKDFVSSLPLGLQTKIGAEGNGISQGQKQRILIARSVYKNPKYLFFDEATNSLDSNNEKIIMGKLERFYKEKTVVVVAHRLSTVKNADQIIVMDRGEIIEHGDHNSLAAKKTSYFELVKNQLEMGD